MELDGRMAGQPALGRVILVNVQIIEHHVERPLGEGRHDVIHEAQEVDRRPSVFHVADDAAGRHVQGGEQRLRPVPHVLVGPGSGPARAQRQSGLGSVERLNPGLFVHAEDQGIGHAKSRARVRTVQRLYASGCWQARSWIRCHTVGPCLGGRPPRGASCSPSMPDAANARRHFPAVTSGIFSIAAIR